MAEEQPPNSDIPSPDSTAGSSAPGGLDALDQSAIEEVLKAANFQDAPPPADAPSAAASAQATAASANIDAEPMQLPSFNQVMRDAQVSSIDLLRDVDLNVKIELGRSRMLVEDVLKLDEGSVVELDTLAGDPLDVLVNERLRAWAEP